MADTPNDVANPDRRNFLVLSTMTMAGIGAAAGGVGLIRTMTPTRDVAGGGVIEVSLEGISEGSGIIATAGRKKYSIRRRTAEEIAAAVADVPTPKLLLPLGFSTAWPREEAAAVASGRGGMA